MSGLRYRLVNWGRWGRLNEDRPQISAPIIWRMIYDREGNEGAPDAILPPINTRDAERISELLKKLADAHVQVIRRQFYLYRNLPGILEVGAAERALQDVIDAGRFVDGSIRAERVRKVS